MNSTNGELIRLDGGGSLLQTITLNTNSTNNSSPALMPDGTIFHYQAAQLRKIAPDGNVVWSAGATSTTDVAVSPSGDLALGGTRISEPHGSRDVAYYNQDGTLRWSVSSTNGTNTQVCFGPDGTLYANVAGLTAYNPDGSVKWQQPTSGLGTALDNLGRVFSYVSNTIQAFNKDTGAPVWNLTLPTSGGIMEGLTLDGANRMYVATSDGWVYAIGTNGSILWSINAGAQCSAQPVIGAGRSLYVATTSPIDISAIVRIKEAQGS